MAGSEVKKPTVDGKNCAKVSEVLGRARRALKSKGQRDLANKLEAKLAGVTDIAEAKKILSEFVDIS